MNKHPDLMRAKLARLRRYAERAIEGDISVNGIQFFGKQTLQLLDALEVFQSEKMLEVEYFSPEQQAEYLKAFEYNQLREIAHHITNRKDLMFEREFQHSDYAPICRHKAIYIVDASKMDNSDV